MGLHLTLYRAHKMQLSHPSCLTPLSVSADYLLFLICLGLSDYIITLKSGGQMLSIEYIHKRVKLFRVDRSLLMVACLAVAFLIWQILRVLMVLK